MGIVLAAPAAAADSFDTAAASPAIAAASSTPALSAVAPSDATPFFMRRPRPRVLPAMYLTAITLQGYDAYSTLTALRGRGVEANPLMKSVVSNPNAFIATKAAVAGLSILAAERMWRGHHRTAAVLTMVASNVMMGVVANHNAQVLGRIH
jgi:hypothetical protein